MARGGKKNAAAVSTAVDPEAEERLRRKNLGFSRNILSKTAVKVDSSAALGPSKTVVKHQGRDILKKSQRKNKYLFSFPGLLGPISGGKIGDLKDLGTKNPILYLDFPQGQMKLFGTIVYPKNRYLTLQFSKGGKNVTCDDYFENMIVFSDAWWIGTKEENPEELRLEFPEELNKSVISRVAWGPCRIVNKVLEELDEVTPTRHSDGTVEKTFKFAEPSEDDLIENGDDKPEEEDKKLDNETSIIFTSTETASTPPLVYEGNDIVAKVPASGRYKRGKAKDSSDNKHTPLVQTTLSSLFKKVEEKKEKKDAEEITNTSEASKPIKGRKKTEGRKSGTVIKKQKKQHKVEKDDIEEFSSTSEDMGASDEDWTA